MHPWLRAQKAQKAHRLCALRSASGRLAMENLERISRTEGKRVYVDRSACPGQSSLLQNAAYALQFEAAAGSHTGSHGASSLRVYTTVDRDKLYDGLAGRPGLQGPPPPYNTPRRRFPGAGVSRVDGLLRNSTPLASEHPSQYGQLYTGAAGAPGHWLLDRAGAELPLELTEPSSEIGAAGVRRTGASPRIEGRRNVPGGGSHVDELLWGVDVDSSADPKMLQAKAKLFEGAAGGSKLSQQGRRTIRGGDSKVDELIWGADVDGSAHPSLQEQAQRFEGAAGGRLFDKQQGRRHVASSRPDAYEDLSARGRKHHPSAADRIGPLLAGTGPEPGPVTYRRAHLLVSWIGRDQSSSGQPAWAADRPRWVLPHKLMMWCSTGTLIVLIDALQSLPSSLLVLLGGGALEKSFERKASVTSRPRPRQ
ncbi:unnamed protein product [Effrenium voratum]|uniref:Uncharacterized protein n=2 Tax=Effrenium voratum TaxID=2562239 RepID=A0AA36IK23_9DINO|nr:unnamed protein product [Effrenium voratum]